jgi:hypothetical protein
MHLEGFQELETSKKKNENNKLLLHDCVRVSGTAIPRGVRCYARALIEC